jgi:DNA-3-methyladenine glycosylase II
MSPEALKALQKSDPVMKRLIKEIGPLDFEARTKRSPFESLVEAVAHQQLHGKAAQTILKRFVCLFPGEKFPKPEQIAEIPDDVLRGCGFSRAKVLAIQDIAAKSLDGVIPSSRQIVKLSDEEIISRLTEVRGVGRWTVEMLLIFQLGRPDVLPVDDFGVRNGFQVAYGLTDHPTKKQLAQHGECWQPHRSTAALYLWRAADKSKVNAVKATAKTAPPPI